MNCVSERGAKAVALRERSPDGLKLGRFSVLRSLSVVAFLASRHVLTPLPASGEADSPPDVGFKGGQSPSISLLEQWR